jgi:hypothetical protein
MKNCPHTEGSLKLYAVALAYETRSQLHISPVTENTANITKSVHSAIYGPSGTPKLGGIFAQKTSFGEPHFLPPYRLLDKTEKTAYNRF